MDISQAILTAKENYLIKQGLRLSDPNTAQKTYWKILNSFLNKCKLPKIPPLFLNSSFVIICKEKASIFNNYFASQCTPFINSSTLPDFSVLTDNSLSSFDITDNEIKDLLLGIDTNKAHGPDKISTRMIHLCGSSLVRPLKIIFMNIIHTGIFPSSWKKANVTPIHKKGDKQLYNNYRPISLLPILAKVFEKIIFKHLYNHLMTNNLISKNQSGFRPGDSCTNQLLSLINDIHKAFDDKNCLEIRSVYLDMSKAFDKVWHDGLLF